MKYLFKSNEIRDVLEVGGKGSQLQKLHSWRAHVAPFFVISIKAADYYLETGIVHQEVEKAIVSFLSKHQVIALRSSMIGEDNLDASFAGMFETILGVTETNWKESLIKIYHSIKSERVQEYIAKKNIINDLKMAVVVQKEIRVEKSGVIFSRSPVFPHSAIAIDAAFGMGEGVVSGYTDVETLLYTRLGESLSGDSSKILTVEENKRLISECLRLEKLLGHPADIEWGILQSELYIFQIRPITRNFGPLKSFADTNLSESYPGVVSPFSARFVKKAYENVFVEAAKILGYSGEKLKELQVYCRDLIGCVDNHLYYNLENYYAVLRALPGGEKNIDNWHKMIGGKIDGLEVKYHASSLKRHELVLASLNILGVFRRRKNIYNEFLRDLNELSASIRSDIEKLKNSNETVVYLCQLLDRPLGFGITILNDFFIMIGLGLLSSSLKKRGYSEETIIDLLKTHEGLDSVKPLAAFETLVSKLSDEFLKQFGEFKFEVGFNPYQEALNTLEQAGKREEVQAIKEFLNEYGDRSFEELKLESLPLKNDPILFKQLLLWGKQNKSNQHKISSDKKSIPLGFWQNKIVLFTRECIEFRETTRLWRGRFYHFIREIVIRLAEQLKSEHQEFSHLGLKDFFSLNHEEWLSFARGKMTSKEVLHLIQSRSWQNKHQVFPEFLCWEESEVLPDLKMSKKESAGELVGQGVSPGEVISTALVLESPTEILGKELGDFVLITKNTDPAWVYIMSRSQGLVSEKGSLLSHTAIIGRELGVPTVVGVKGATSSIKTGDRIKINGQTGEVIKL